MGHLYALAALPFHLLYHFYNGISFIAGLVRYSGWRFVLRRPGVPSRSFGQAQESAVGAAHPDAASGAGRTVASTGD